MEVQTQSAHAVEPSMQPVGAEARTVVVVVPPVVPTPVAPPEVVPGGAAVKHLRHHLVVVDHGQRIIDRDQFLVPMHSILLLPLFRQFLTLIIAAAKIMSFIDDHVHHQNNANIIMMTFIDDRGHHQNIVIINHPPRHRGQNQGAIARDVGYLLPLAVVEGQEE